MRKIGLFLLVMAISAAGFSQGFPMGGPGGGGRRGPGGQVPSIGHFYGRVVDSKTDKGLDGASVQLVQSKYDPVKHAQKDTVIAGMITERKGDFSLENLPIFGNFRLRITAIGYKTYEQKIAFDLKALRGAAGAMGGNRGGGDIGGGDNGDMQQNMAGAQQALNAIDKDLGNIKMSQDAETLEEATVTASKPLITMGVDRKIYNVEKDISAAGGSATDVMRNVPSVQVDIDGNVTLRNSTPTIFVDGRPTTLTLDQIPADAIESVEIITNPGAKYDASGGTSGILNIVLKKNRKAGYNGNVRAGIDQRGKVNFGGNFNVKQGKVNFFIAGNYNQRKSISIGNTSRDTYGFFGFPADSLLEHDNNVNDGYFAFGRAGIDYLMDNRNTLSISGNIVHGTFTPYTNSDIYVDTLYPSGTTYSYTSRYSTTNSQFNNHGGTLSFKHTFPRSGEEWSADANYSQGGNDNLNLITSNIYNVKGGPLSSIYQQQQVGNSNNKYLTAQTDYTLPISEKSKFEAGARVAIRNISSVNNIDTMGANNQFQVEGLLSSQYSYRDRVFAAYGVYSNAIKDFSYQIGLRAESSDYNGTQHYTNLDSTGKQVPAIGQYSNSYPISLFPSIFLTQKLGGNQELALNYTRRIDRPSFFQLFPFTDYSDSTNVSRGNPNLKPQFTNSFELSYQKTFPGNNTLLFSTYYKHTTDLITRYPDSGFNPISHQPVIISTYINATSSFVGGFEIIARNTITNWWDLTSNLNIFTSKINGGVVEGDTIQTVPQTWAWFGKLNNSFKIFSKPNRALTLQVSGDFTSKTVLPPGGSASSGANGGRGFGQTVSGNANGYSRPSGGMDAALRFEFLKTKAASITLSCSDILRTRVADVYTYSSFYTQEYDRRRDPQFFRLQFNWRFGKFDAALFKRKNNKADMDNMQNMQGGGMPGGGGSQPQN